MNFPSNLSSSALSKPAKNEPVLHELIAALPIVIFFKALQSALAQPKAATVRRAGQASTR